MPNFFSLSSISLHFQTFALYAVMRFYHMVRSGVSFKINETFIELWQNSHDDSERSSTTISLCEDDDDDYCGRSADIEDNLGYSKCCHTTHLHELDDDDDDVSDEIHIFDKLHQETQFTAAADDGSDEGDSLLVGYDKNSIVSLWRERQCFNFIGCQIALGGSSEDVWYFIAGCFPHFIVVIVEL